MEFSKEQLEIMYDAVLSFMENEELEPLSERSIMYQDMLDKIDIILNTPIV